MILVTGATGFLGGEIVRRLIARGDRVRGVDVVAPVSAPPAGVEMQVGDLRDPEVARAAMRGAEYVIHAAAVQHHTPGFPKFGGDEFLFRNVTMTRTLLAAAREAGVKRFAFVSTDMVYGPEAPIPMRESCAREPVGPYGASKVACEDLCAEARGWTTISILRPSVILGPGRLGILVKLFDQIRKHQIVWMIGNGRNRHHMIEVGDCAAACILAIDRGATGTYNLGTERPTPTRDLLAEVCRLAGSRSSIRGLPSGLTQFGLACLHALKIGPMNPEQFKIAAVDYVLDISATKSELGWAPVHSDVEALFATYRHYLKLLGQR